MPSDQSIKKDIVDNLYWDARVNASDIKVDVKGGKVTLSGSVPNHHNRYNAVLNAWSVKGVKSVGNDIKVKYPSEYAQPSINEMKTTIQNILFWNPVIDSSRINISIDDEGVVYLKGTVDQYFKKREVEKVTSGINGVSEIINNIDVVPSKSIPDEKIIEQVRSTCKRRYENGLDSVKINSENGIIELKGNVDNYANYREILEVAENTSGVVAIINNLKIII